MKIYPYLITPMNYFKVRWYSFYYKKYSTSCAVIWTNFMINKLLLLKSNHDNLAYFKKTIQSDVDTLIMQRVSQAKNTPGYTCIVNEYKSMFYS